MLGEDLGQLLAVVVPEGLDMRTREVGTRPETGVRQLVYEEQVARSDEHGDDAGVRQIPGAENARRLRALETRQLFLELDVQRMVASDQARRAGAGAVPCDRVDRGLFYAR